MSDPIDFYAHSERADIERRFGTQAACAEVERDICLAWLDYMASQPTSHLIAAMDAFASSAQPSPARQRTNDVYLCDLENVDEESLPFFSPRHLAMREHPSYPPKHRMVHRGEH